MFTKLNPEIFVSSPLKKNYRQSISMDIKDWGVVLHSFFLKGIPNSDTVVR